MAAGESSTLLGQNTRTSGSERQKTSSKSENFSNPDKGEQKRDTQHKRECEEVRKRLLKTLSTAHSASLIDNEEYGFRVTEAIKGYEKATNYDVLEKNGDRSGEAKVEAIRELETYANMFAKDVHTFANQLRNAISSGKREGALTKDNIDHIRQKLSGRRGDWQAVKAFFGASSSETLTAWQKNWSAIAQKSLIVKQLEAKLQFGAPPALKKLRAEEKKASVLERLKLLHDAEVELRRELGLETEGKQILQKVAAKNSAIMNDRKIQRFLKEKFYKYKGEARVQYVRTTLPSHTQKWLQESDHFRTASEKARKRGASVVSEEEYFSMSYPQRRTAFTQLQSDNRKAETQNNHPLLSQAQKMIDEDAWDKAEALIRRAEFGTLNEKDQRRIFDLRQQINMERDTSTTLKKGGGKEAKKSPMEDVMEKRKDLRNALAGQPESIRLYYKWALEEGGPLKWMRMRRLRVWHYNVAWANRHGFMNNEEEFLKLKKDSEKDTAKINEQGHSERGVEKLKVGQAADGVEGSNRKFEGGRSRGATWHVFGKSSMEEMRKCVDYELDNERKTYWGLSAPEGVTLKQTLESFELLNPKIKALQNAEQAAGTLVSQEAMYLGEGAAAHTATAKA